MIHAVIELHTRDQENYIPGTKLGFTVEAVFELGLIGCCRSRIGGKRDNNLYKGQRFKIHGVIVK